MADLENQLAGIVAHVYGRPRVKSPGDAHGGINSQPGWACSRQLCWRGLGVVLVPVPAGTCEMLLIRNAMWRFGVRSLRFDQAF